MKITFLLPVPAHNPLGGAKVVYEYANGLSERGHSVTVVHTLAPSTTERGFIFSAATYLARGLGLRGGVGPSRWMAVRPSVNIRWAPSLQQRWIPNSDAVIATSWHTAEFASNYSPNRGRKFYLVQDFEFYKSASPEIKNRMAATYRANFRNLAISPACIEMITECGGEVVAQLPNGLDHKSLRLSVPIESSERVWIGFPVRKEVFKRTNDAIAACALIRETAAGRNFRFWGFGASKPDDWPEWLTFVHRPSDAELISWYNRSAVFLVPSEYEGWGLPGSEAMCCGAALVSTKNGGVDAYATNGVNALLVEPGSVLALATQVGYLIENTHERIKLAKDAERSIRKFNWKASVDLMEALLR